MATDEPQTWTVLRLLEWTKDYFTRSEIDSPRIAAEVLLSHVLNCQRIELYARYNQQPDDAQRQAFRALVKRAAAGEPVAYLVGSKEFYSLAFEVNANVLIPRPETEQLVERTLAHLKALGRGGAVWDVCTGSGCIAVAVAHQAPGANVLATDLSAEALAVAERNAAAHDLADRITFARADLLDRAEAGAELAPFDVIVSNPPYVAEGDPVCPSIAHEPRMALYAGQTGMDCLAPLIESAGEHLGPDGRLIVEFGFAHADPVRDAILATGQFDEPHIYKDLQGIARVAEARRRD